VSYTEFLPHPALRAHVDRFWVRTSTAPVAARSVLPDGCIDVMVDLLRGEASAVGTMTRAVVVGPAPEARTVAVRFRPGGAIAFLKVPAEELTDRVVECAALGLRWVDTAELDGGADLQGAVRALERVLLARLSGVEPPHPIVTYAVRALYGAEPPTIATLMAKTGWTRQHQNRMFLRHVGVGPKMLARVARLQRAVADLQRGRDLGLADAAVRLGYFDQAHMALDFRRLLGVTPSAVAASRSSIFPMASLLGEAW
jgi:AraC-like DNA-binding protein